MERQNLTSVGKKIVSISKRNPATVPPYLSALRGLVELGFDTSLYSYYLPTAEVVDLERYGITVKVFSRAPYPKGIVRRFVSTLFG